MDVEDPSAILSDQANSSVRREATTLFCECCLEDGNHFEAEGFCVDCAEHLCDRCFEHHCTPRPFRNHQLLDKQQMPQTQRGLYTDNCHTHKDEVIKYYCEDHQAVCSAACVAFGHRTCNVANISTLAQDIFNSNEYKTLKDDVKSLIQKTTTIEDKTRTNVKHTNVHADRAIVAIKQLRKQVNEFFYELEHKVRNEVFKIQQEDQENMDVILKKNDSLAQEIQDLKQRIFELESKNLKCRVFVAMKEHQHNINRLRTDLSTLENDNKIRELTFKPSTSVTDFISDHSQVFGSLVSFYQTVPINSPSDTEQNCSISNIAVLSGGRIAVYHSSKDCVEIVDTKRGQVITKELTAFDLAYVITTVSDNEIAVLNDGLLQLFSVTDTLKLQKTIRNKNFSASMSPSFVYTNNRFILVTWSTPRTLSIVDMNGEIIKTFPTEHNGENLFEHPAYLALNPDQTLIYVADWGNSTVTCLALEGDMRARFRSESDWMPHGLAVSRDGDVYVCDFSNDSIRILTSDLREKGVILGSKYGIRQPQGLAYCHRECKLYVGLGIGKHVGVFNI